MFCSSVACSTLSHGRQEGRPGLLSLPSASEAAHAFLECSVMQDLACSFLVHLDVSVWVQLFLLSFTLLKWDWLQSLQAGWSWQRAWDEGARIVDIRKVQTMWQCWWGVDSHHCQAIGIGMHCRVQHRSGLLTEQGSCAITWLPAGLSHAGLFLCK